MSQGMHKGNIIFYYHHFGGYGHGMRIFSLCKALSEQGGIESLVINSGMRQDELGISQYARVLNLPAIWAKDGLFTGLEAANDLRRVFLQRKLVLKRVVERFSPDIGIVEHFPFGRQELRKEIVCFISDLRKKNCKVYSSVRDISLNLPKCYEKDLKLFNGIFVHDDPSFSDFDFGRKSYFTGRVVSQQREELKDAKAVRKDLNIAKNEKFIVVSVGGGIDGAELLEKVISVKDRIDQKYPCKMLLTTGKGMSESAKKKIKKMCKKDIFLTDFDNDLLNSIKAADLVLSMAGYNSVNNILITETPVLFFPRTSDGEQIKRLKILGIPFFDYQTISSEVLCSNILKALKAKGRLAGKPCLDGAEKTSRLLISVLEIKAAKVRIKTRCNLDCAMCSWKDKDEILEFKNICEILEDLYFLGIPQVNFTGGEPTTHSAILKILSYTRGLGLKTSLSTNGYNTQKLGKLTSYIDYADISLDSHDEQLNDFIRGRKGAYKAALNSIELLSKKGVKVHVNVTVRPDNYTGLHVLILLLASSIRSISFTLVDTSINNSDDLIFKRDQLEAFYFTEVPLILAKSVTNNIKTVITPFFKDLENLSGKEMLKKFVMNKKCYVKKLKSIFEINNLKSCALAKSQIRINANGDICPCCYLDDYPAHLGNIKKDGLLDIISSDTYFDFKERAVPGREICKKCKKGYRLYARIFK